MITRDANVLRDQSVEQEEMKAFADIAKRLIVIVLNSGRKRSEGRKISDSLWILPTNSPFAFAGLFKAFRIARKELFFQGRLQVDLVTAQDAGFAGFTGWFMARAYGKPLHVYVRHNIFSSTFVRSSIGNRLRSFFARLLVRQARTLCVGSEAAHTALADIDVALADDATVIPYSIDVQALLREPIRTDLRAKYPQFKFILLMVAPLVDSQNVGTGIAVLAEVARQYPHVGLVIVGEGPRRRQLESLARREGVADRVVFEKPTPNVSSYYKTAHVFLVTAPYEEYADTISEAAAASCAILSSDVGTASAFITDGDSGFLCDPRDASSYSKKIMRMLHEPALRERLRLNALVAIERYAEETNNRERSLELYKRSWERAIEG